MYIFSISPFEYLVNNKCPIKKRKKTVRTVKRVFLKASKYQPSNINQL